MAFQVTTPHHRSFLKCGYTGKKKEIRQKSKSSQVKWLESYKPRQVRQVTTFKKKRQVKEVDTQEPIMLDQDMLDVDMLVGSSIASQVSPDTQENLMLVQHMLDVNMLVWSNISSQVSQDKEEKSCSFNTCCMSTCFWCKGVWCKGVWC